ncbi:MAG: hydrolase [Microbacteriaceae bacterium]|jgi:pimeloyl-ACP methyl ester carboxylesterase|nr:hydrolase [Microbacteriaceae bacterium]
MPALVRSADGTEIAYDVVGEGPLVIVIGGAFNTRHSPYPLVSLLGERFSVVSFDRRGRGDSRDAATYAVEREVEDVAALIDATGGSAMVYGHSSGAILALESAAAGLPVSKVAAFEPPYTTEPGSAVTDGGVVDALDAGDPELAAERFMRLTGMDDNAIQWITGAPFWAGMVATAPTLRYDLALAGNGVVPSERFAVISVPTLAIDGGASPKWASRASDAVVAAVPRAIRVTIEGQNHAVDQGILAPVLTEFFSAPH